MERFASPGGLNKNDLLFQQLYTSIRDGKLPHGTRLASENELAEQHPVPGSQCERACDAWRNSI